MEKLYAISATINKDQICSHCWGKECGRGLNGVIDMSGASFILCDEPECPIEDDTAVLGQMNVRGDREELLVVRKLRRE